MILLGPCPRFRGAARARAFRAVADAASASLTLDSQPSRT
jgi:hypothetical protein